MPTISWRRTSLFKDFRLIRKKRCCKYVAEKLFPSNYLGGTSPKSRLFHVLSSVIVLNGRSVKWSFFIGQIRFGRMIAIKFPRSLRKRSSITTCSGFFFNEVRGLHFEKVTAFYLRFFICRFLLQASWIYLLFIIIYFWYVVLDISVFLKDW